MPGSRTSLTYSSVPNTFPGRSRRAKRLADDLELIVRFFSGTSTSTASWLEVLPFHFTVLSK